MEEEIKTESLLNLVEQIKSRIERAEQYEHKLREAIKRYQGLIDNLYIWLEKEGCTSLISKVKERRKNIEIGLDILTEDVSVSGLGKKVSTYIQEALKKDLDDIDIIEDKSKKTEED